MRWFKHLCDASDDEFLIALEHDLGPLAYGRWWRLCEIIGKRLKKNDATATVSLPVNDWATKLKCKPNVLQTFLERLTNDRRITFERSGNIIRITFPKLLKYRDEWSGRSGVGDESLPSDSGVLKQKSERTREQKTEETKTKPLFEASPSGPAAEAPVQKLKRKTGMTATWMPPGTLQAEMAAKHPGVDVGRELERFRNYWLGVGKLMADWSATYRNWILRASENPRPSPSPGPTKKIRPAPMSEE